MSPRLHCGRQGGSAEIAAPVIDIQIMWTWNEIVSVSVDGTTLEGSENNMKSGAGINSSVEVGWKKKLLKPPRREWSRIAQ